MKIYVHKIIMETLEAITLLGSYDLVAITETWWNESHDWSVTTV